MVDTLRIKRRTSGAVGPPAALGNAEVAYNEMDNTLYYGAGGTPAAAASILPIAGQGAYLRLTGGTVTGATTFSGAGTGLSVTNSLSVGGTTNTGSLTTTGTAQIGNDLTVGVNAQTFPARVIINAAAGINRNLLFYTNSVFRWVVQADSTPETGSNAGSNFNIVAFGDAGAGLGNYLSINRATALVTLTALATTGVVTVGAGTGPQHIYMNGGQNYRDMYWQTNGVARWQMFVENTAESGSNAGSNFGITAFNDAGVGIATPISITRATGLVRLNSGVAISGASTIDGAVIGGTTPAAGAFTTLSASGASTHVGAASFAGGVSFGSQAVASPTDLSKHIALYSTSFGFSVTNFRLNYEATGGASHYFQVGGFDVGYFGTSGLTMLQGAVTLLADPTAALQAATKQYVDHVGSLGIINVKAYGALGDNSHDDTSAIVAAIAAAPTIGALIYFPSGQYRISSALAISGNNLTLLGAGDSTSIITTSATADIFDVTGTYVTISRMTFSATVARTAGIYVYANNANYFRLSEFTMLGFFRGIQIDSPSNGAAYTHISHGRLENGTATASGIVVNGGVEIVLEYLLLTGNGTNFGNGVLVNNCGDCTLDHVSTVWAGNGLGIAPAAGQIVQALFVNDCEFDTGSGAGIDFEVAGQVQLAKIYNTWVASNTGAGIGLNTSGTGAITQVDILNCSIAGNHNSGIIINTAACTYTSIVDTNCSANAPNGITIAANVNWFKILGCTLGQSGEFAANTTYGLVLNSGCNNFIIANNFMNGNVSGPMNPAVPAGAPNVTWFIRGNVGYVTYAQGTLVTTAGPTSFTVTHGLGLGVTPALSNIRLTLLSGLGAATYFYPGSPTSTTFVINFNAAPGAGVNIAWEIRMWGS